LKGGDKDMAVDMDDVKKVAKEEFQKERFNAAKAKYKGKLEELEAAKKVVRNIERELIDIEDEINDD
jgi:uncharacterized membrane protein (DUF106 family)